ncbi:LysM peptidoglycan-binding domain-containing protein [Streptomyces sp. NBC_00414]
MKPEESLSSIARRYRLKGGWQALYKLNRRTVGAHPNILNVGTMLRLPAGAGPGRPLTAQSGGGSRPAPAPSRPAPSAPPAPSTQPTEPTRPATSIKPTKPVPSITSAPTVPPAPSSPPVTPVSPVPSTRPVQSPPSPSPLR